MSPERLTRRAALARAAAVGRAAAIGRAAALAGVGPLALAACGSGGSARRPPATGSTLDGTWGDPVGDGQLRPQPGERALARTELGPVARETEPLATIGHLTDAHVLDASSPARVTFLDRLGPPFQSTFRPQETLTAQVLDGAVEAVRALRPQLVLQGGDLIDNDQHNELALALAVLGGGTVRPGSGAHGYDGVQLGSDVDPFYYRPAVDAPRHPRLLADAVRPFVAAGSGAPIAPVFGDHDALVAGTVVPTALTRSLALGDRALWDLPSGLHVPDALRSGGAGGGAGAGASPDGPPDPGAVDALLREALRGPTVRVGADPRRRQLSVAESLSALRSRSGPGVALRAGRLDYAIDLGDRLRVVVLDLVRRGGGSGGEVVAGQAGWLAARLTSAERRWVLVVSHQPIATSDGGSQLLSLLARSPRVVACLHGHTHRNLIEPRRTPAGGYWEIATASLIDYPQQARALRISATAGGGVAIRTWMLDHAGDGPLGPIARQLSYIDAQGGRPQGFAGRAADRNVVLYRRAS